MILTSPDAIAPGGVPKPDLVAVLKALRAAKNATAIISNHAEPAWFAPTFGGSGVQFGQVRGRQDGKIVSNNAERLKLPAHDTIVLAGNHDDVKMGKNGGAVIIAAGWSSDEYVKGLGIRVADAAEFSEAMSLIAAWTGTWWFAYDGKKYSVRALADLSSKTAAASLTQVAFAKKVTTLVKNGGPRLWALLTCVARSLIIDGFGVGRPTIWGVFPSSASKNDDSDVLCDFTHRLRTTVSRVRHAEKGVPLFVRHRASTKRSSAAGTVDRTDPREQLETVHLQPDYAKSIRGKHAVVVDDCTTYGVSFGVAAALLRRAGAASVTGIALGKFGGQFHSYAIEVTGDPFAPLTTRDYRLSAATRAPGSTDSAAQSTLLALFP